MRMTLNEYIAAVEHPLPESGIWTTFPTIDGESWEDIFILRYGHRNLFTEDADLFRDTLKFRASVALPYRKEQLEALSAKLSALKADQTETTGTVFVPPHGFNQQYDDYIASRNTVTVKGASDANADNMRYIQDEYRSIYEETAASFGNLFYGILGGAADDN